MNVKNLCKDITDFGFALVESGFALDANFHVADENKKTLMWVRDRREPVMIDDPSNINCYLSLIEKRDYSYLMSDGGVIQIAFAYDGRSIRKHRLLYHPCPFPVMKGDIEKFDGRLSDFINDKFMNDVKANLLLRSPIRFDYAPDDATDFHPASHLTLNDPDCRIPARSPLQFGTFIEFVFQNFYLNVWTHHVVSQIRQLQHANEECLSAHDRRRIYLNWEPGRSRQRPNRRAPMVSQHWEARLRHQPPT